MFRAALSAALAEYQLRDRLSFMRCAGLAAQDAVPDAKTIWLDREQLTRAGALAKLFVRFDTMLAERDLLALGRQIVDATVVEARPPQLTKREKAELRDGGTREGCRRAASTSSGPGTERPRHPPARQVAGRRAPSQRSRLISPAVTRTAVRGRPS